MNISVCFCNVRDFSSETVYVSDLVSNIGGGEKRGTIFLGNINVIWENKNFNIFGFQENELRLNIVGHHGEDPSTYSGDYGITSNIEAPANTIKIFELYNKKNLKNNIGFILFGLHDLNTVFYTSEPADLFLNSTFGIGAELSQIGGNGPSIYPTTSVAAIVSINFFENSSISIGIYDGLSGNPDKPTGNQIRIADDEGYLFILEYCLSFEDKNFKIGSWNHSRQVEKIKDTSETGHSRGGYIIFDKSVESVSGFFKYGVAQEEYDQFSKNLVLGLSYEKPFFLAKKGELGFAMSSIKNSQYYVDNNGGKERELIAEFTYKFDLNEFISLQPDFQYIKYPSASSDIDYANVITLRTEISF